MSWFRCVRSGDVGYLTIMDDVGLFSEGEDLAELLSLLESATRIELTVRSDGGNGLIALELYHSLVGRTPRAVIERSASAGTLLAMAGDQRFIREGSKMMIHPAQDAIYGNVALLLAAARNLERLNRELIDIFAERTGQPLSVVRQWHAGPDRWFDAQEAIAAGLVHGIVPREQGDPEPREVTTGTAPAIAADDGSEALLVDMIRAIGPIKTRDRKRLFAQLSALFREQVQQIED